MKGLRNCQRNKMNTITNSYATQFASMYQSAGNTLGVQGNSGSGQSSATISGPGQLLSDLEQLQAQNPAEFKQVVTQIASQLQAAAQQQGQTPQGQFLSKLASEFQNVANGGSLSQLQDGGSLSQLQSAHHGHHHHHHTYNSSGQTVQSTGSSTTTSSSGTTGSGTSSSNSGTSIQQLFSNIFSEVSQALAGTGKTSAS